MSAPEAVKKWGISERRVQILCSQGRIEGVLKRGMCETPADEADLAFGDIPAD